MTLTLSPHPNPHQVDGVLGQMFYWRVNKSGLTSVDYVAKYEMIVTAR